MRRRTALRLGVLGAALLGLAAAGLLGREGAERHVRAMSGGEPVEDLNCLRCHGPGGVAEQAAAAPERPTPRDLAATADGRRLYVACGPTESVLEVDAVARRILRTFALPGRPGGVAVTPDGGRLAVTLRDEDAVLVHDLRGGEVFGRVAVGFEPRGVGFAMGGSRLVVANARGGTISVVDVAARREVARLPGGSEPYTVVVGPDDETVAVVSRKVDRGPPERLPASRVSLVDAAAARVLRHVALPSAHMAEGAAFAADGSRLLVPALAVRNRLPILQVARGWTMSTVLAVVEVATGRVALLPLTEPHRGFADPAGIALAPDGRRALVASGGLDEVGVLDVDALLAAAADAGDGAVHDLQATRRWLAGRAAVGSNPADVVALGDGGFAVAERLGDAIAFTDAAGAVQGRLALAPASPPSMLRRGEQVFHDARYAFQGHFSCRSCHPGAGSDGLTYDFDIDGIGRDVVLNRSLHGVAGTAPFKWIGLNPTLQRQCGPRFAMVLSRADVFPEPALEALVAYLHSLPPPRPVPAAGRLAERDLGAVERGRVIFHRHERKDGTPIPSAGRCVTCHPPPLYTSLRRADVGTKGPTDSTGLFDIPHLTGIASKAPYLHDGRAPTLEEIWTQPGVDDQHGVVTDLGKQDLNDLIEFLRGL